jgi:hypothetical protein
MFLLKKNTIAGQLDRAGAAARDVARAITALSGMAVGLSLHKEKTGGRYE